MFLLELRRINSQKRRRNNTLKCANAFLFIFMKRVLLIIFIIVAAGFFVRFVIGGSEDTWICRDGRWVKHGAPVAAMPSEPCPLTREQEMVKKYISENISEISPIEAVLGGSWYVLDVEFLEGDIIDVTYEDGHIMAWLEAKYRVEDGEVVLSEVQVLENDKEIEGTNGTNNANNIDDKIVCEDRCGDGECEEIVCMAVGCPCAETAADCPEDCTE